MSDSPNTRMSPAAENGDVAAAWRGGHPCAGLLQPWQASQCGHRRVVASLQSSGDDVRAMRPPALHAVEQAPLLLLHSMRGGRRLRVLAGFISEHIHRVCKSPQTHMPTFVVNNVLEMLLTVFPKMWFWNSNSRRFMCPCFHCSMYALEK